MTDQDRTNEERGLSPRKEEMRQKISSFIFLKIVNIFNFYKLIKYNLYLTFYVY
jgi:hypothetical protein